MTMSRTGAEGKDLALLYPKGYALRAEIENREREKHRGKYPEWVSKKITYHKVNRHG